jgi:Domain of unknown function (DUF4174)
VLRHSKHVLALVALFGSIIMNSVTAAHAEHDPLSHYRWTARVLVVIAADPESPDLAEQKRQIESLKDGAAERELVVVQPPAGSAEATALRRHLGLGNEPFQAVLVGKDGGAKLRAAKPIAALTLMAAIDAMPMRQEEMRRRARSP